MQISGWGRYPVIDAQIVQPLSYTQASAALNGTFSGIARGMGRSYGDSSLAPQVLNGLALNHILAFDAGTGVVTCQAGVTLKQLLEVFVPQGWFLPVTPGTKFVSVAGAIASDVHGKNHHLDGSFSDHLEQFTLLLADGSTLNCSASEHRELFLATCGGMGLTGIILQASIRLKPINSAYIDQVTIKAPNLDSIMAAFAENESASYSVAWIDCLSQGKQMGRSILTLGEHADDGDLDLVPRKNFSLPVEMPGMTINPVSVKAFNTYYYHKIRHHHSRQKIHFDPYFYPLDALLHWNRLYGKQGFTQYQFVIPKAAGTEGMRRILKKIVESGRSSPLTVLKAFGKNNENYLSFPQQGFTLALDFKIDAGVFTFLNELDSIVLDYGGRLYLTKDARMSEAMFKQGYPQWEKFVEVRRRYGAEPVFHSMQSQRLGI